MWGKKPEEEKRIVKVQDVRLSQEAKDQLEKTLLNLNLELSRLRSLVAQLEKKGEQQKKRVVEGTEDKKDIIIYLKRIIGERDQEIADLKKEQQAKENEHLQINEKRAKEILDKETEYFQMVDDLTKENTAIENRLYGLLPLQLARQKLLNLIGEQEIKIEEQAERHKWEIYNLETQVIIKKDAILKDITKHIDEFLENLQKLSPIRLAAAENHLVKQNTCLNNLMVKYLRKFFHTHRINSKLQKRCKSLQYVDLCNKHELSYINSKLEKRKLFMSSFLQNYDWVRKTKVMDIDVFTQKLDSLYQFTETEEENHALLSKQISILDTECNNIGNNLTDLKKINMFILEIIKEAKNNIRILLQNHKTTNQQLRQLKEILLQTLPKEEEINELPEEMIKEIFRRSKAVQSSFVSRISVKEQEVNQHDEATYISSADFITGILK